MSKEQKEKKKVCHCHWSYSTKCLMLGEGMSSLTCVCLTPPTYPIQFKIKWNERVEVKSVFCAVKNNTADWQNLSHSDELFTDFDQVNTVLFAFLFSYFLERCHTFIWLFQQKQLHLKDFTLYFNIFDHKIDNCTSRNSITFSFKFFKSVVIELEHQVWDICQANKSLLPISFI